MSVRHLLPPPTLTLIPFLLLTGCRPALPHPSDPRHENSHQIHQLERHRTAFEAYATGDRSEAARDALRPTGLSFFPDPDKSGRVQFDWPSQDIMPALDDFHPILIYCPRGEADLPADFWTNQNKHRHPHRVDDHWFAALRNWMTDPPPPRP